MAEAANPLVLPALYQATVDFFAEEEFVCDQYFGWRGPTLKALTNRRISWVPGDPVGNGNAGKLTPAVQSEGDRALATFEELFTVYVYAADASALTDEKAQYTAAMLLYQAWFRAVFNASGTVKTRGRFGVVSHTWETAKKERPHGACLRVLCSVQNKITDTPYTYGNAETPATAELIGDLGEQVGKPPESPALGDVEETQTIEPEE